MWPKICTTWPEKPHCGNCGVPFMNSTTSLFFTSLSMNCSIAMMSSLRPQIGACLQIYVSQVGPPPQGPTAGQLSLFDRGVERSFDLEYVVLIEPVNLDDG